MFPEVGDSILLIPVRFGSVLYDCVLDFASLAYMYVCMYVSYGMTGDKPLQILTTKKVKLLLLHSGLASNVGVSQEQNRAQWSKMTSTGGSSRVYHHHHRLLSMTLLMIK